MNTTEIIPAWNELNVCETTRRLVDALCENCDSADQYITDNANFWSLETLVDMLIGYDAQEAERQWEEDHGGPAEFHRVGAGDNTMICRERPDGLPDTNAYYEIHAGTYWRGNEAVNAEGEIVEQL